MTIAGASCSLLYADMGINVPYNYGKNRNIITRNGNCEYLLKSKYGAMIKVIECIFVNN